MDTMVKVHRGLEDRLRTIAANISYKPGYVLTVNYDSEHAVHYLQVKVWREDITCGEMGYGYGGKMWVTGNMTEQQIVQGAFGLFKAYEEHEAREWFEYCGKRIYGPHIELEALLTVADMTTY